jgi:hypothetical protein
MASSPKGREIRFNSEWISSLPPAVEVGGSSDSK